MNKHKKHKRGTKREEQGPNEETNLDENQMGVIQMNDSDSNRKTDSEE